MYNAMKPSTTKFNVNKDIVQAKVVLTVSKTLNLTRYAPIGPIILHELVATLVYVLDFGIQYPPILLYYIHIRVMKSCPDWVSGWSGVDLPDLHFLFLSSDHQLSTV